MGGQRQPTPPETIIAIFSALKSRANLLEEKRRRRRAKARRGALILGVGLAAGLLALNVGVSRGLVHIPTSLTPDRAPHASTQVARRHAPRARGGHTPAAPVAVTSHSHPRSVRRPVEPLVRLRMVAVRGSCWLLVRRMRATGPVLYDGILEQDASLTVRGTRVWVSFGAAGNLDLWLNGKTWTPGLSGTVNALVSAYGLAH